MKQAASINPEEIAKFEAMAEEWWDEQGKFRPLHQFNPVRLGYIRNLLENFGSEDRISGSVLSMSEVNRPITKTSKPERGALKATTILDIGCGGGLLAEPLARLGYTVKGIDASEKNINIATTHARQTETPVNYEAISAEALAATGAQFDLVCAMEVIEHVEDIPSFLQAAASMVKPGGSLLVATLNRTPKSFALAIIGAEYILRWLPIGTHDWKKFLKPSEIVEALDGSGMELSELKGATYNPLNGKWHLNDDISVNYMLHAVKHR